MTPCMISDMPICKTLARLNAMRRQSACWHDKDDCEIKGLNLLRRKAQKQPMVPAPATIGQIMRAGPQFRYYEGLIPDRRPEGGDASPRLQALSLSYVPTNS